LACRVRVAGHGAALQVARQGSHVRIQGLWGWRAARAQRAVGGEGSKP
jgi:hypothetical protein